jgi:CRISPR-associated protein Csm1
MKACDFCGVYPKQEEGEGKRCRICNISEKLGETILKSKFLHFTKEAGIFQFLGIGIDFSDKYQPGLLSYAIEHRPEDGEKQRGSIVYNISNYLPKNKEELIQLHNDDEKSLCFYCKEKESCKEEDRKTFKKSHLSFQCIATHTPLSREGKGVNKLAILKADIDNLGYIVQYGFDRPAVKNTSKYSVSRYTFLSRMIDAFFQYWLKDIIAKEFPMIYTVYAGGDDLLLIGPWAEIIKFSKVFNDKFKEFMGNNPDITLSAGISLFSPHSPVTTAAAQADANLEQSKDLKGKKEEKGKDAITLFDTTVKWKKLDELFNFAGFLDDRVNDDKSGIKVAFLYRLFKYRRMFMDYKEKGIVEGLRFHSLMNYDVKRNIERKENDKLINPEEVEKLRPLYVTGESLDKELLENLKIPLYIALFNNRGGK